jgi:ectoine hydroxylase-related dioxygenase (phytanoyl-CoA dioxygenase family)
VLKRIDYQNHPYDGPAPEGSVALERDGHFLLRGAFSAAEIGDLRDAVLEVYRRVPPDLRAGRTSPENAEMFRYEMFNRSALCQQTIARREILDVVEPLLGADCHVVACTAWQNPPGRDSAPYGQEWHFDAGPHVPRKPGTEWPEHIPYPAFVIATHVYLDAVELADGPTAFVSGSHTSGGLPPRQDMWDLEMSYRGRGS